MNLEIKTYKNKDEFGIVNLDNSLLLHKWNKRNLKNWYWKYKKKKLIIVAKYKKIIMGHFAAIEIDYVFKNFFLKGSHSVGLMVQKKWQSRGISALLFKKLTDIIKKKKIKFIYCLTKKIELN